MTGAVTSCSHSARQLSPADLAVIGISYHRAAAHASHIALADVGGGKAGVQLGPTLTTDARWWAWNAG